MKKFIIYSLTTLALLSGCSTTKPVATTKPVLDTLSMKQIHSANYGAYPSNYQSSVRQHLQRNLLDYDSAKIEFYMKPVKVFYTTTLAFDGFLSAFKSSHEGENWAGFPVYLACVNVNAKNTYGGYTGWQTYEYYFQGDTWYTTGSTGSSYTCTHAAQSAQSKDIYVINGATHKLKIVP